MGDPQLSAIHRFQRLGLALSANGDVNDHNINPICLMLRDPPRRFGLSVYYPSVIGN